MRKNVWKRMVSLAAATTMAVTLAPVSDMQAAKKAAVASVTVTNVKNKKLSLKKGKSFTVKVTVKVKGSGKISKAVSFKSSKKEVVSITAKGKITAKKKGTAVITVTSKANKKKTARFTVTVTEEKKAVKPEETEGEYKSADKTGYKKVWADEFNGKELNRNDWNVELHEAGWVNAEQQEYVDSKENICVKDGTLVITPVEKMENGKKTYTSGRVNTQNKQDFKYGMFEARLKVPKGQGFWPAFWLLPTDESFYGQWPKCGEIDCLEILGHETNKLYGTIHYGNPYEQNQGTYVLPKGEKDFSEDYHVFDVAWEPGKITWYVDGVKYHEADNWYSAVEGQGTKTYPAPFDQPFYVILNLAVGGEMPGNVDETTSFKDQKLSVDYVRVYQKEGYDENVKKPVAEPVKVELREPDANGNYIMNGDFAQAEDLGDDTAWKFMTQQNGEASAEIKGNAITIKTTKEGDVDYAVQLMNQGLPVKKDSSYTLSFDAKASAARKGVVSINSPDRGYKRYLEDRTIEFTTEKKTFSYDFVMRNDDDANARLDFNLGKAGSTADIEISNVKLVKTADNVPEVPDLKTVRANGNYVYNGTFDEGEGRLGSWEISDADKAKVSVTNADNGKERRLKVTVPAGTTAENPVVVAQSDLGLTAAGTYELSYKAFKEDAGAEDKSLVVSFAGKDYETVLTKEEKSYAHKIGLSEDLKQDNADFALKFTAPGTYYVDDVMLAEHALIKNGSFRANMTGYEAFIGGEAKGDYIVDSISSDNAFAVTIHDSGSENWHVQLMQRGVSLEKGKFYRLSFKAKSSLDRKIECVIDGDEKNGYEAYFPAVKADLTKDYKVFTQDFEMKAASDGSARFDIALGKIDKQITTQHSVFIDDISLVEIDAKDADVSKTVVTEATDK